MDKVKKCMEEFKEGKLHSGSKDGPKVMSRKQAIAIGLSEERKRQEEAGDELADMAGAKKKKS